MMDNRFKFRVWDDACSTMYTCDSLAANRVKINIYGNAVIYDTYADDAIIMQYTGLVDKNGTEIYEGDVVECIGELIRPFTRAGSERTGIMSTTYKVIEYRSGVASFCLVDDSLPCIRQSIAGKYYRVVGNIHQHPELLK